MKNLTIIQILLFIILMIAYTCTSAQDYVINTSGDTLKGSIKILNFGPEKKVQVSDAEKTKTTVSLFKTRSFVYKGEVYRPVRGEKGYAFMKLKKDGYLSLYAFQMENQTAYDGQYLVKRDGKSTEVPNLSFKKIMTKFLADCPDVAVKIENGDWSRKELDLIIDTYNQCVDKKFTEMANKATVAVHAVEARPTKETPNLNSLEDKLKSHAEFEGKTNALEMVGEMKNKIQRGEKIPNFLTQGLKSTLDQTDLKEDLDKALTELN
jgi:hypothetical protein